MQNAIETQNSDIRAFFENAEKMYLDSLLNGSPEAFLRKFQAVREDLLQRKDKHINPTLFSRIYMVAERIKRITSSLIMLSNESNHIRSEASVKANAIVLSSTPCSSKEEKQDSLNSQFLRRWFLEHVDHPFPSTAVKEELAELTNAKLRDLESRGELPKFGPQSAVKPISKNQCQLWFINTRRRSTWTEFYREFAFSNRSTMTKLVTILKDESENTIGTTKALARLLTCAGDGHTREWFGELKDRVAKCQEQWKKIMEWLEQRPHEQQSDWLSHAIDEATSEYNQMRKRKRDQRRKELGSDWQKVATVHSDDDDDYNAVQLHSRKRAKKGRASDDNAKPLAENRRTRNDSRKLARRPSTMANSTDQGRNVSGSSTSTLHTSCSSISTSTCATASSPLASYGKGQESLKLKNTNHLEGLYKEPTTLFSNSGYKTIQNPASPLQYGDDELGDDDGEFELDDCEEVNQSESPRHRKSILFA